MRQVCVAGNECASPDCNVVVLLGNNMEITRTFTISSNVLDIF